jgi:peptide/nickel transport system ATP-binding protein/oligopeptide transport system ATP-binding protein
MYLGRVIETARADDLFASPRHPYTRALLSAIPVPRPGLRRERRLLQGDVPSPLAPPPGCHLHTRCPYAADICKRERPALLDDAGHATACHFWPELPHEPVVPEEAAASPRLEKLLSAFTEPGLGRG